MQKRPSHRNDSRVEIHVLLQKSVVRRKSETIDWPHFGICGERSLVQPAWQRTFVSGIAQLCYCNDKSARKSRMHFLNPCMVLFFAFHRFHTFHRFHRFSHVFIIFDQSFKTRLRYCHKAIQRRKSKIHQCSLKDVFPDWRTNLSHSYQMVQDAFSPWFDLGYGG